MLRAKIPDRPAVDDRVLDPLGTRPAGGESRTTIGKSRKSTAKSRTSAAAMVWIRYGVSGP
jgi:hypothetical protein